MRRNPFVGDEDAELRLEGSVEPTPAQRHLARFTLSQKSGRILGTRTVISDTPDCHSLDEAAAIILAVMLNVKREDVEPEATWKPRASASASVLWGLLPRNAVELTAAGGAGLERWAFELELSLALDGLRSVDEGVLQSRAGGGRLSVSWAALRLDRLDVSFRLAVGGGAIWVSAAGFDVNHDGVAGFAEARLGARVAVRLWKRVWLQARADIGAVPLGPAFKLLQADGTTQTLFQPAPVIGALGAGLSLQL